MSSQHIPELTTNECWPGIIDSLLEGTPAERDEARETLWVQVEHYVVRIARPPIGPLADDPDVRAELAVRLMERLEQRDFRHLRHWREAQRYQPGVAAWWGWIRTLTRNLATDLARGSRQNLARRGEPYRWARIVPVDPTVLEVFGETQRETPFLVDPDVFEAFDEAQREALVRSVAFLNQASEESLESFFDTFQDVRGGGSEHGSQGWALPSSVRTKIRDGSGKSPQQMLGATQRRRRPRATP